MTSLMLPRTCLIPYLVMGTLLGRAYGKWVEGHVDTKENWAFLARFCFLSFDGQFEYLIEFDRDMGTPNLLLYYDDDTQWPAVYHSSKTCKEREAVLNKGGQNQIIQLSHWYPDTEVSGCVVTKQNKELPAEKSRNKTTKTPTAKPKTINSTSIEYPLDPLYYEQFLKTTTPKSKTTLSDTNASTWYEILPTDDVNFTTTVLPEDEWESIEPDKNGSRFGDLRDVEILFDNNNSRGRKIKRSTLELYDRFRQRRLNSESNQNGNTNLKGGGNIEKLVVSCHHSRRFKSARERWWFIAISNCDSPKGLDVRYKFLMTNGPDDDFWHTHFSADEFYVLPVLIAYGFAYVIVMVAVVICSVELKSRHLLHTTYKLFLISIVTQHSGIIIQTLAFIKYALNGFGSENMRTVGQFLCGISETTFLLLLVLMAKGYTITRGRLKVSFTIKLTVFMCCYILTYVVLFVYQAKAFDPGDVLYLYESPAGYGLIVLRVLAWCMFAYSTFFTVKKYPQKNTFYGPFCICGTLWFFAGPLFILTANSYIDKWVRESVVTAVLLFISFNGHFMFLILTLPIFANKNFPYHVRTTQIGVMEVAGTTDIDFGHNAYHPNSGAAQTVIIPLTRRTEELIGNMYSQYMASAPPNSLGNESPKQNGVPKRLDAGISRNNLLTQDSSDTNNSEDIKPYLPKVKEIFTVEGQMAKVKSMLPDENKQTTIESVLPTDPNKSIENGIKKGEGSRSDLPTVLRSRRNILEPIIRDVPSWSLAKGPCVVAMQLKKDIGNGDTPVSPTNSLHSSNAKKVPPVRNSLQPSSGEISTIHEGHIQSFQNGVSRATIDLFTVGHDKG